MTLAVLPGCVYTACPMAMVRVLAPGTCDVWTSVMSWSSLQMVFVVARCRTDKGLVRNWDEGFAQA